MVRVPSPANGIAVSTRVHTGGLLQRAYACGVHTGAGQCVACAEKERTLQRFSTSDHEPAEVPPIVYEQLRSAGQPLDPATRAFFETRFGYDFSRVRVHTDAKAAESARAVNALAYTVGQHIVFSRTDFPARNSADERLLAHELTHVVQQMGERPAALHPHGSASVLSNEQLEAEAVSNATKISRGELPSIQLRTAPAATIMRETTPETAQPPSPVRGCTELQAKAINTARLQAYARCAVADGDILRGARPTRARDLARQIFSQKEPDMSAASRVVLEMRDQLMSPTLPVVCESARDRNCGNRSGYVVGRQPPVHLCPAFFSSSSEQQVRTMVHEAAHLAGIGNARSEHYLIVFNCESASSSDMADAWSHFVHCLTRQPPDRPELIEGKP